MDDNKIVDLMYEVLDSDQFKEECSLLIIGIDENEIRQLNERFRSKIGGHLIGGGANLSVDSLYYLEFKSGGQIRFEIFGRPLHNINISKLLLTDRVSQIFNCVDNIRAAINKTNRNKDNISIPYGNTHKVMKT